MRTIDNLAAAQTSPVAAGDAVVAAEIAKFDALAPAWWDPAGPMRPLHAMNPLRADWIGRRLFPAAPVLDVGCGAGLLAEALARRGHPVTGIDLAPAALAAARRHAGAAGLPITYREADTATLVAEGARFPAVAALEVIEHVDDPAAFLHDLARLAAPGGQVFISTLNRSARSLMVAKWGAEYVLRLLPPGTHAWQRFITPAELSAMARDAGLRMTDSAGLSYAPLRQRWTITRSLAINYITAFAR